MKYVSFKLSVPGNDSTKRGPLDGWESYYIIMLNSKEYKWLMGTQPDIDGKLFRMDLGDGYEALFEVDLIDRREAKRRNKRSKGFWKFDWVCEQILLYKDIMGKDYEDSTEGS